MSPRNLSLSLIGLGKLGMPLAACFASRGFNVICFDSNPAVCEKVTQAIAPVFEPGLQEMMARSSGKIRTAVSYKELISGSSITFIVVPTPSERTGALSITHVLNCIKRIGTALQPKSDYHTVVLTSTVLPGDIDQKIIPALERSSGKKNGIGFGFCYNPEFIALGNVIEGILNPDFILVGESNSKSGDILEGFWRQVCPKPVPLVRMNCVNAEIAKISLNAYVTTKISFANMLSEMCEKLPGSDVEVVTKAIGLDSRIGKKYLKGALPFGGPCFPRDNQAFIHSASLLSVVAAIPKATIAVNERQRARLLGKIATYAKKGKTVGILGLAFKPETDVVEFSPGIDLAEQLVKKGKSVAVYDPLAMGNAKRLLASKVTYAASVEECVQLSDIVVLATPCKEFAEIRPNDLKRKGFRVVLFDCWRILDASAYAEVADYVTIGRGSLESRARKQQRRERNLELVR